MEIDGLVLLEEGNIKTLLQHGRKESFVKHVTITKSPAYGRHQLFRPLQIEAPIPIKWAYSVTKKEEEGGPERLPVFKAPREDNPQVEHLPCVDNPQVQSGTTPCFQGSTRG